TAAHLAALLGVLTLGHVGLLVRGKRTGLNQFVSVCPRASRTAVNPSVPCTWGRQRMKPARSGAMGKSDGGSIRQPARPSRNGPTTPSFSSGSSEHVA